MIEPEGAGGLGDLVEPPLPTPSGTRVREEPLSQNRDFLMLLGGQGISAFGDALSLTALPLLVLAITGSGIAMGILLVATAGFALSRPFRRATGIGGVVAR